MAPALLTASSCHALKCFGGLDSGGDVICGSAHAEVDDFATQGFGCADLQARPQSRHGISRRHLAAFVGAVNEQSSTPSSSSSTPPSGASSEVSSRGSLGMLALLPRHLRWQWRPHLPPPPLHHVPAALPAEGGSDVAVQPGARPSRVRHGEILQAVGQLSGGKRQRGQKGDGSLGEVFLAGSAVPQASVSSFKDTQGSTQAEEMAADATAQASIAEVEVRKAVQEANDAAEDALAAAQVAVWTEIIGAIGTCAGLFASFIGLKMDDSELPEDVKLPDTAKGLPQELLRPPPGTRVDSRARGNRGWDEPHGSGSDDRRPAGPDGPLIGA